MCWMTGCESGRSFQMFGQRDPLDSDSGLGQIKVAQSQCRATSDWQDPSCSLHLGTKWPAVPITCTV